MIIERIQYLCDKSGIPFNPAKTAGEMLDILDAGLCFDSTGGPIMDQKGSYMGSGHVNAVGKRVALHEQRLDTQVAKTNYYFWGIDTGGEA